MQLSTDAGSDAAGNILDSLFGTAGNALDTFAKWKKIKTDDLLQKAQIPTTASKPGALSGISTKELMTYGGIGLGLLVVGLIAYKLVK